MARKRPKKYTTISCHFMDARVQNAYHAYKKLGENRNWKTILTEPDGQWTAD
jgi:hypothetical protein